MDLCREWMETPSAVCIYWGLILVLLAVVLYYLQQQSENLVEDAARDLLQREQKARENNIGNWLPPGSREALDDFATDPLFVALEGGSTYNVPIDSKRAMNGFYV